MPEDGHMWHLQKSGMYCLLATQVAISAGNHTKGLMYLYIWKTNRNTLEL